MDEQNDRGRLQYSGNEIFNDSVIDDPPKYRGGIPTPTGCCVAFSGDLVQNGRRIEKVLIQFKATEDGAGMIWLGASDGQGEDDANMRTLAEIRFDGAHFTVPVYAPNLGAGGSDRATYFTSPGKRYWGVVQDDGAVPKLVLYRGSGPEDPTSRPAGVFEAKPL